MMSDIHLEFSDGKFDVPVLDTDSDSVLVLAGDIGVAAAPSTYKDFLLRLIPRFRHIIYIQGNHEHYGGSVQRSIPKILRAVGEHDNLSVIENEVVRIENTDFICGTLWTDLANGNPMAMMQAQMGLNDFNRIRTADRESVANQSHDFYARRLLPVDTFTWHKRTLNFIIDSIEKAKKDGQKTVVVTHHAPSYQSIHPRFKGDDLNVCFASPLDDMIMTLEPDYWIHGHLHDTNDYNIGHTNIVSNPRGYYPSELNHEFDPLWTIDLS